MKNYITTLTLQQPAKHKVNKVCGIKIIDVLTGQVIGEVSEEEIIQRNNGIEYVPGWLSTVRGEW